MDMTRRKFSREFKIEAVKLVTERGVAVAQACRDLELAESVLRRWMREATVAPASAFPGNGQQRLELAEIAALKKEVAKLRAERDTLKNRSGPLPACARYKQPVLCCARRAVADGLLVGLTSLKNVAHADRHPRP